MGMVRYTIEPPAPRVPVAVLDVPTVVGEALVLYVAATATSEPSHRRGFRGWAEVYTHDGVEYIEVVSERAWYQHRLLGTPPVKVTRWPARAAWVA